MTHREDSVDNAVNPNLRDMIYAESEIGAYNHLHGTTRSSLSMRSEDWQFDDHDNRSEQSGISYATSGFSDDTIGPHVSQSTAARKTKKFPTIGPVRVTHVDEDEPNNKTRGTLRREASEVLPLDRLDTEDLGLFDVGNTIRAITADSEFPIHHPGLFAKESFGEEKL